MRLDRRHEIDDYLLIKGLVEPRGPEQVPRVDHQINEAETQERLGRDVPSGPGNGLPGRCRGERLRLASCRVDNGGDWIVAELVTGEQVPSLIAINAGQQQRREAVADHDVLDQLTYRELRRRRPVPGVRRQLTHNPFELSRRGVDQLHIPQVSGLRCRAEAYWFTTLA